MPPKKTYTNNLSSPSPAWSKVGATMALPKNTVIPPKKQPAVPGNFTVGTYGATTNKPMPNLNLNAPQGMAKVGSEMTVATPTGTVGRKTDVTPMSPSNTGTTGTQIKSPAGQDYLTGLMNQAKGIQAQIPGMTPSTPTDSFKNTPEYKAYLEYKRTQENPEEAKTKASEAEAAMQRLADVQNQREAYQEEARKRYEKLLDQPGGLLGGTQAGATLDRRRSNQEDLDLALKESAAARTAGVYQTAAEAAKKEGYTLGKDQVRYEYNPATGSYDAIGGTPTTAGTEAYTKGTDPVVDSWVSFVSGGGDMSKVPENLRNQVVQGISASGGGTSEIQKYQNERIGRSLSMLDTIEGMVGGNTVGVGSLLSYIPGTDATDLEANLSALKANIGFNELTAMRAASPTGGALGNVSDTEIRLLTDTLGGLSTRQSPANFAKNLAVVKQGLQRIYDAAQQDGMLSGGNIVQTAAGAINTNW